MPSPPTLDLSIIIKTYNEEAKIAAAISSAIAAAQAVPGLSFEVLIADSHSTDRTVQIAQAYPTRIVQLVNPAERSCGVGVEMGYRWSKGAFIYILDGDMELDSKFLQSAIETLTNDLSLAGVGGIVVDRKIRNDFDRIRVKNKAISSAGEMQWLEGGGLYRRTAIEQAGGYAANKNLRGYEEAELGIRLRKAGYRLLRLPRQAAIHDGHALDTYTLLRHHWRSRRAMSVGVLLRIALGSRWPHEVLPMIAHPLMLSVWWVGLVSGLVAFPDMPTSVLAWWLGTSLFFAAMLAAKKRSLRHAATSIVSWHYGIPAIAIGLLQPLSHPNSAIHSIEIMPSSEPVAAVTR